MLTPEACNRAMSMQLIMGLSGGSISSEDMVSLNCQKFVASDELKIHYTTLKS